jgi:hypothetical protein
MHAVMSFLIFLFFSSYITDDENVLLFRTRIPRQLDDFFISLLLLLLARLSCVGDEPSSLFPPLKKNWASRKMYVDLKGIVSARKKSNNTSTASRLDTHESRERKMMEAEHDSGPATNFPLS